MGTWGTGVFDNDYAMDMVTSAATHNSLEPLQTAFSNVDDPSDSSIPSTWAQEAIAAAALVLAAFDSPELYVPKEYVAWLRTYAERMNDPALIQRALTAIDLATAADSDLWIDWDTDEARDQYLANTEEIHYGLESLLPLTAYQRAELVSRVVYPTPPLAHCSQCFPDVQFRGNFSDDIDIYEAPDGWLLITQPGHRDNVVATLGTTRPYPDPDPTLGNKDEKEEEAYYATPEGALVLEAGSKWVDLVEAAFLWQSTSNPVANWRLVNDMITLGYEPDSSDIRFWIYDRVGTILARAEEQ